MLLVTWGTTKSFMRESDLICFVIQINLRAALQMLDCYVVRQSKKAENCVPSSFCDQEVVDIEDIGRW